MPDPVEGQPTGEQADAPAQGAEGAGITGAPPSPAEGPDAPGLTKLPAEPLYAHRDLTSSDDSGAATLRAVESATAALAAGKVGDSTEGADAGGAKRADAPSAADLEFLRQAVKDKGDTADVEPDAAPLAGNPGEEQAQLGVKPDTHLNIFGMDGVGTVDKKPEVEDVPAADATLAILPSPTEDAENEALREEHPSLLTKDEALDVADRSKIDRSQAAYMRGEAKLLEENDEIISSKIPRSERNVLQRDLRERQAELRKMHRVTDVPEYTAEVYRKLAEDADRVAENTERWSLVLHEHPTLADKGWDMYRLVATGNQAESSRQQADSVRETLRNLKDNLAAGSTNLVLVLADIRGRGLFGKDIDQVLSFEITKFFSGDKSKTIKEAEDALLAEAQMASTAQDERAERLSKAAASLAEGKIPDSSY